MPFVFDKFDWLTKPEYDEAHKMRSVLRANNLDTNDLNEIDFHFLRSYYSAAINDLETNRWIQMKELEKALNEDERVKLQTCIDDVLHLQTLAHEEWSKIDQNFQQMDQSEVPEASQAQVVVNSLCPIGSSNPQNVNQNNVASQDNADSQENFENPKKRQKLNYFKIQRNRLANTLPINIPLTNSFSALNANENLNSNNQNNEDQTPKTRGIQVLLNPDNKKDFINKLTKELHCDFKLKPAGKFTKIEPKTPADYTKIIEFLDKDKTQHFLFGKTEEEKASFPLKAVIRGLPIDTTTEEIREELEALGFEPTKVTQMFRFKTKAPMPLFQIHLPPVDKSKDIFNLTEFMHYSTKIDTYNRPKHVIQCYNCQYLHHSQSSCRMKARCVKCSGEHESRACPNKEKMPSELVKCCNCGLNHTASYRGCKIFPQPSTKNTFNSNKIRPGQSYATITAPKVPETNNQAPPAESSTHTEATPSTKNVQNSMNSIGQTLDEIANLLNVKTFTDLASKLESVKEKMKATEDMAQRYDYLREAFGQSSLLNSST